MSATASYKPAWLAILKAYDTLGPNVRNGRAYPYQCAADPRRADGSKPWTCGWGHLMSPREEREGVKVGDRVSNVLNDGLTLQEADELLAQDLAGRLLEVRRALPAATDLEVGAFLDCVFNCGPQCLYSSPGVLLRAGKKLYAAERLLLYRKAGGIPYRGLWRRRVSDAIYMLSGEVVVIKDAVPTDRTKTSPAESAALKKLSLLLGKPTGLPPGLQ